MHAMPGMLADTISKTFSM